MTKAAFLVVPVQQFQPGDGWANLSRAQRLDVLRKQSEGLTEAIRARLQDMEVAYMAGLGNWTVKSDRPIRLEEVALKLEGLPVTVAPNLSFRTT